MKKLLFFILLSTSVFCLCKTYGNNKDDSAIFQEYLNTFEKKNLPLLMDSSSALHILDDTKKIIEDDFQQFIPMGLKKQYPNNNFRYLYLLPNNKDIIVTLIFQEYMDKYENDIVNQYIVTYDTLGNVIDYQELAGYFIDMWDAFMSISDDYTIKRDLYNFIPFPEKEPKYNKYFLLEQTISEYRISESGAIIETKKITREGYFDGDIQRYHLIKLKE